MKKRIMLVLMLGLSFAPPAFARGPETIVPGEMKVSQHDGRSIACALQQQVKRLPDEAVAGNSGASKVVAGAVR